MFFGSVFALGAKTVLLGAIALTAGLTASGAEQQLIVAANLWLVTFVAGVIAVAGFFQMVTLNVRALAAIRNAFQELRLRQDLDGDGRIGAVNFDPTPVQQGRVADVQERLIELIPTNKPVTHTVLESDGIKIDRRDFLQFLYRSWESNGQSEKGTARVYWCGGVRKDKLKQPQYVFKREDGSSQYCTREYYDAIVRKLESLGELENRQTGMSGVLRRDPKEWIGGMKWL